MGDKLKVLELRSGKISYGKFKLSRRAEIEAHGIKGGLAAPQASPCDWAALHLDSRRSLATTSFQSFVL